MEEMLRSALAAIKGIKIPDFPKAVLDLNNELSRNFPNNQALTEIIESNTKLSGDVLKIVNSALMKGKAPLNSIREAVDVLGTNNLKNVVLSAAMTNMCRTPSALEIIEHSKEVAFCCAELAEFVQGVTRDEAYLLGLFHNGGSLLLAVKDTEQYLKLFAKLNTNPVTALALEKQTYGAAHPEIGLLLGQKWKLPVEMLNAIMLHHRDCRQIKNDKVRGMVAMLKIANFVVNELSFGAYISDEAKQELAAGCAELMLSSEEVNEIRNHFLTHN